jgi:predicted CXXCH cytochrome family protein
MPRPKQTLPAALVVGLSATLLLGCGKAEPPADTPSSAVGDAEAAEGYVGLSACEECHAEQTAAWRGSHHDLAMQPADETTVLGDFNDAVFEQGGVRSRFFRRDGRYFVNTDGPDGRMAEFEIQWTFGAVPLQQYLVEFPDGRLQALGIAWDTRAPEQGGRRWFHVYGSQAIPWNDELHWTKPANNWNYMCADCHSTGYRKRYDAQSDSFAPRWSDVDVACEACHGPGAGHVQRARAGGLGDDSGLVVALSRAGKTRVLEPGATTMSLPGAPGPAPEVEACARCHSRRAPVSATYRHGRPLMDSYVPALLSEPLYFPDGQIRDEVYVYGSFRHSRMYKAGVGCNDCHDPHSASLRAEGDAICAQCHLPGHYEAESHARHAAGPGAPGCRDCHMPARLYMVVDLRRDHSFRVPRPDLADALAVPDACAACHADRPAGWSAAAVRDWLGRDAKGLQQFAAVFAAARAGRIEAGDALRAVADDPAQPAIVRGTALELLLGYPSRATLAVAGAAVRDGDPAVRLAALGLVAAASADEAAGIIGPLLSDPVLAVRIEAARLLVDADPADLGESDRQHLRAGLGDYVEAQRASLDRAEAWANLGAVYAHAGRADEAQRQYQAALSRNPDFVPAYVNLADLQASQGDEQGAGRTLNDALARLPGNAYLRHALGLHLVRSGNHDDALVSLRRATELDPGNVRFRYVYAVALDSLGQGAEAIAELERAHLARPADLDVLWALASISLRVGNSEAARRYGHMLARLRPGDPQVEGLLNHIGQPAGAD